MRGGGGGGGGCAARRLALLRNSSDNNNNNGDDYDDKHGRWPQSIHSCAGLSSVSAGSNMDEQLGGVASSELLATPSSDHKPLSRDREPAESRLDSNSTGQTMASYATTTTTITVTPNRADSSAGKTMKNDDQLASSIWQDSETAAIAAATTTTTANALSSIVESADSKLKRHHRQQLQQVDVVGQDNLADFIADQSPSGGDRRRVSEPAGQPGELGAGQPQDSGSCWRDGATPTNDFVRGLRQRDLEALGDRCSKPAAELDCSSLAAAAAAKSPLIGGLASLIGRLQFACGDTSGQLAKTTTTTTTATEPRRHSTYMLPILLRDCQQQQRRWRELGASTSSSSSSDDDSSDSDTDDDGRPRKASFDLVASGWPLGDTLGADTRKQPAVTKLRLGGAKLRASASSPCSLAAATPTNDAEPDSEPESERQSQAAAARRRRACQAGRQPPALSEGDNQNQTGSGQSDNRRRFSKQRHSIISLLSGGNQRLASRLPRSLLQLNQSRRQSAGWPEPGDNQHQHQGHHQQHQAANCESLIPESGFKIVLMGTSNCGKTSLIRRFLYDTFNRRHVATVEDTYFLEFPYMKSLINISISDTSGTYQFPAMKRLAINSSDAFVLVYSVDDPSSFEELQQLRQTILEERERAYLDSVEAAGCCNSNSNSNPSSSSHSNSVGNSASASMASVASLAAGPGAASSTSSMLGGTATSQSHSLNGTSNFDGSPQRCTKQVMQQQQQQQQQPAASCLEQHCQAQLLASQQQQQHQNHNHRQANGRHWSLASLFNNNNQNQNQNQNSTLSQHQQQPVVGSSSLGSSLCSSTDNSRRSSVSAAEAALRTRRCKNPPMVIVANKCDLPKERHLVNSDDAEALAVIDWNNGFVRTSAALNWNINQVFQQVLKQARQPPTLGEAMLSKRRKSLPQRLPDVA